MNAIVLQNIVKRFKRQTVRREYTTLKTELVRWLTRRQQKALPSSQYIEALKGVDLVIPQGKTVGIIGRNGSGKSTLLKIVTGIYSPTGGTMKVEGRISALLELGAGFHPDFTGRENIMVNGIILGLSRTLLKERMDDIIRFSELGDFIDQPVRTYSSGMFMRLAFAVATHVDPDILIIDEILSVGDAHFAKKSMAKMNEFKASGKTILLVTHDASTVESWCDQVAWIDGGKVRLFGDPRFVVEQYQRAVSAAEAELAATGTSALSSPGGALPETGAPGRGTFELDAPKLCTMAGVEADQFDTEDGLELLIAFRASEAVEGVSISVSLSRGGTLVYGTSTGAESVGVPVASSGHGLLRLRFERLGLLPGWYSIEVAARDGKDALLASAPGVGVLKVTSSGRDAGLVRLSHRWTVESGPSRLSRVV